MSKKTQKRFGDETIKGFIKLERVRHALRMTIYGLKNKAVRQGAESMIVIRAYDAHKFLSAQDWRKLQCAQRAFEALTK